MDFLRRIAPPPFPPDAFLNGTVTTGSVFTNQNVRILGTVTVTTATFTGCSIFMDADARLIVANSGNLTMNSSAVAPTVVFGCTNMWQSIEVNPGATISLTGCTIQDAKVAILLKPGYNTTASTITGCTFQQNITSIKATNFTGMNTVSFGSFLGNTFQVTGPLLPPFTVGSAVTGISLGRCAASIGTLGGGVNRFSGLTTGIGMAMSDVSVRNCEFRRNRLQTHPAGSPTTHEVYSGCGIYSESSSLSIIDGAVNGISCTFRENRIDVYSSQTNSILLSNIRSLNPTVASVIILKSDRPARLEISRSFFEIETGFPLPIETWVQVQRPSQQGGVNTVIERNFFNIRPASANVNTVVFNNTGVLYVNGRLFTEDAASIRENEISCEFGNPTNTITSTIHGIIIGWLGGNYSILDNRILYNQTQNNTNSPNSAITSIGIYIDLNKNNGNRVERNLIRGVYLPAQTELLQTAWLRCGIHSVASPYWTYCTNNVGDCTNHYHFINDTKSIEFGRNTTTLGGRLGLVVDQGPIPNNHDFRRNLFTGAYSGAPGGTNPPTTPPGGARWLPAPMALPTWLTDIAVAAETPAAQSPSGWFTAVTAPSNIPKLPCDSIKRNGDLELPPTIGQLVKQYTTGAYGVLDPVRGFDMEQDLFRRMIADPTSYSATPEAIQFYNTKSNTTAWQLANADQQLRMASAPNAANTLALQTIYDQNATIQMQLQQIEMSEAQNPNSIDALLQAQKLQYLIILDGNWITASALHQTIWQQAEPALLQARSYVNNIPTTTDLEANRRMLLLLQAKQALNEIWTDTDFTNLRAIANGCPDTWGESVKLARRMLPSAEANSYPAEGEDPGCTGRRSQEIEKDKHRLVWSAWPNPAHEQVMVSFQEPFTGQVILIDALGKLVHSSSLQKANSVNMNLQSIASGTYAIKVVGLDGVSQGRILIIHH